MLSSVEEAPAVVCILVAQHCTVISDELTSDIGTNFSQIDWFIEQTVDVTINSVKQLLSAAHKPSKRQMALHSSECERYLREWDRPFLKDGILYRRYTLNDTIHQLVTPEIYRDFAFAGLHDDASHRGKNHTISLIKVSNGAKIRNRYNQVPHLTQDTNGKVTNSQKTPQTRAKRSALSQQVTTKHI